MEQTLSSSDGVAGQLHCEDAHILKGEADKEENITRVLGCPSAAKGLLNTVVRAAKLNKIQETIKVWDEVLSRRNTK